MKYLLLITLVISPLFAFSQEKIVFKKNKAIEYEISQNILYVKFLAEKKDKIKALFSGFELISENEALITQHAKGLKFKENAKVLKTKINEQELDIFPVLLHKNGTRQICDNEILIKIKNNVSLDELLAEHSYALIPKNFNKNLYLVKLENMDISQVFTLLNQLQNNPNVEYAEPDFIFFINQHTDDTYYTSQWSINNQGYLGGTPDADMDVDAAWKFTKGEGVKIAVIDGGVQLNHPDLVTNANQ